MADGYQAVALGIKPQDPSQTFDSLNSILGLQQKRQGLQIQAQQLQQEQLKTQQQQGVQDFFKSFDPTDHIGADGTTDVNSVHTSDTYKNAGNAKPLIDQTLGQIKQQQLTAKQSLQSLNDDALGLYTRGMNTLQNDDDVKKDNAAGRAKVDQLHQSIAAMSPDMARVAGTFGPVTQHAKQGDLSKAVGAVGLMGADVIGQRGQQNPQQTSNAQQQILNRDVGTGALSAPPGGTAPSGGPGGPLNPTSSVVAGNTARTTAVAGSDIDRANEISAKIQPSQAAIGITQRVDDLANQISSGKFAKWVMDKAAAAGNQDPAITARQLLEKDLGQVKSAATASAATDKKMDTILAGYPEATSTSDTIHGAMDYIRGSFRQNVARGELLNKYRDKKPNLEGFQHADDVLTGHTEPLMHEFNALKTRQERVDFYKRNFHERGQAEAFTNRVSAMGDMNVLSR